ncbi:MAG: NAD(P)H-dependent oxidoreductase subunit E, partial [Adhaeribacter sp.]
LKTVECLAACGMGPMLQILEKYYENLDPQKMDQLLDDLSKE